MNSRIPRGGRGSNQYQTKPGGIPLPRTAANLPGNETSEDVAWRFHPDRAAWIDEGFTTWAETRPWSDHGFSPLQAGQWNAAGFDDPDEAAEWRTAFAWCPDPEDATSAAGGFHVAVNGLDPMDAATAAEWYRRGFRSLAAFQWREHGFTPETASAWRDLSVLGPEECAVWRDHHITPTDALLFHRNGITPEAAADRMSPEMRSVDRMVNEFVGVPVALPHVGYPVLVGDTFTCDHGALVLAHLCDLNGIPRRVCVGEYQHTNPETRFNIINGPDATDGMTAAEYAAQLKAIEQSDMAEHHHWVVAYPGTDHAVLLDPNGPIRNEPYVQSAASGRYREFPPESPWRLVAIDPDLSPTDTADQEADSDYPSTALRDVLDHLTGIHR